MSKSRARKFADIISGQENVPTTALGNVPPVTPTQVSDQANTSTGYLDLPSGTTAQRPSSANSGYTRFNTDSGSVEFYDGTDWIATNLIPEITSISGNIYQAMETTLTFNVSNTTDTVDVSFSYNGSQVESYQGLTVTNGSFTLNTTVNIYGQSAGAIFSIIVKNVDGTPSSPQNITSKGLPSGGVTTVSNGYRYHLFTTSGNFVVGTGFTASYDALVVAGGGGGGGWGGGGGAGGVVEATNLTLATGTYPIVVGGGGAGGSSGYTGGVNGTNSSALSQTVAIGGGGGGWFEDNAGKNGGSGGGAGITQLNTTISGGSGTSGQGNAGGNHTNNGNINPYPRGGGGGGAAQAGAAGTGANTSGGGGAGSLKSNFSQFGDSGYFGGGGGGHTDGRASPFTGTYTTGGVGGGGDGGRYDTPSSGRNATSGTTNTGGGGGGAFGGSGGGYTGVGGSGVVIIRYPFS